MAYAFNPFTGNFDVVGQGVSALNVKGSVADVASLPGGASVGDVYLVEADAHFYVWDGAAWDDLGTLQGATGADGADGADGVDGKTILNGSGAPSAGLGVDGDFYLDTTATAIYGPKTAGAWGSPTSLIGPKGDKGDTGDPGADGADGKTVLNGTGAPSNALGVDGDFYIDTAASDIYGPKTAGAWGAGTSLVGPAGADGGVSDGDKGDITVSSGGTVWSVNDGAVALNELSDVTLTSPSDGQSLSYNAATGQWVNSTPAGGGTVTSVGIIAPTGFSVSGSPVTTSGNITLSFAAGYSLPTTASQTNWDTAYSERLYWDGGATGLDAATGRTSLGLGDSATLNVGTTTGTVAAGDDSRFTTDLTYTASTRVLASSTGADATLPLFTSTEAGLTPLSGGGTTNFLRADGTWAAPVSGGTPGGTAGQIQWNSSGSFAGVGGSTVGATGDITLNLNGAADTPPLKLTGTWFTGGTSTTTKPQVLIEPSGTTSTAWSTSGTGLGINAPSGFAGNLLDLQLNGLPRVSVRNASTGTDTYGELVLHGASASQVRLGCTAGNKFGILFSAAGEYVSFSPNYGFLFAGGLPIGFSNGLTSTNVMDVRLYRDGAANTLAQRNGTNAQTYRLYNTLTGSDVSATGNYERAFLQWNSSVFEIGTEAGSGGGSEQPVRITAATLKLPNLPTYADNAAAITGGLVAGDVYKTATGELRITV